MGWLIETERILPYGENVIMLSADTLDFLNGENIWKECFGEVR